MLLFSVVSLPVASCILLIHARAPLTRFSSSAQTQTQSTTGAPQWTNETHTHTHEQSVPTCSSLRCEMWRRPPPITTTKQTNYVYDISCVSWMVAGNPCDEKITIKTTDKIQNQFWWHIVLWSWAHEPRTITHALRVGTYCTQRMGWIYGAEME